MTKNHQKNGSLNRDLLNFWYRYGIFRIPGESSCPDGLEYVWQRGVHNGRTVAPEAILFESPCRANSETKMAKA